MNNTPDYNNLAFAPGDWSDSRVNGNTDRTASTIQLVEKIEELEKENAQLRKWCEEFNALTVAEENKKLRDAIKFQNEFIAFVGNESTKILSTVQKALLKMEQSDVKE